MVDRKLCTGCGACAAACTRKAIHMEADREGFQYPVVRNDLCTACGLCAKVCPLTAETAFSGRNTCFGAKAKQDGLRLLGSSGGIFPLLAAQMLRNGGRVWGAAFAADGTLRHTEVLREADLPSITRTKYIQSDLSQVWDGVRTAVRNGLPVLFCGTPCQTDGLRSFLGAERNGVILVDLICYGVPSPGIWKRYAAYLARRYGGSLETFSFRDKRNRDNGHTCAARIGGTEHVWPLDSDLYCRSYFRGVNLRPACTHCQYCSTERHSDITLGDFWGIEQIRPDFDDGMGCSAVICHTDAGRRLWEQVQPETSWFACREEDIANEKQPRLREPVQAHPRRQLYMQLRQVLPFPLWLRLFQRM